MFRIPPRGKSVTKLNATSSDCERVPSKSKSVVWKQPIYFEGRGGPKPDSNRRTQLLYFIIHEGGGFVKSHGRRCSPWGARRKAEEAALCAAVTRRGVQGGEAPLVWGGPGGAKLPPAGRRAGAESARPSPGDYAPVGAAGCGGEGAAVQGGLAQGRPGPSWSASP